MYSELSLTITLAAMAVVIAILGAAFMVCHTLIRLHGSSKLWPRNEDVDRPWINFGLCCIGTLMLAFGVSVMGMFNDRESFEETRRQWDL